MGPSQRGSFVLLTAIAIVAAVAGLLAGLAWLLPSVAGWTHAGQVPQLTLAGGVRAVFNGPFHGQPAAAYARDVRALLPGALGFWSTSGLVVAILSAAAAGVARAVDVAMSRPVADRRWYQLRGRRAHEFGRYRTVAELIVSGPAPDRVVVGTIARPKALIAVTGSAQIAVTAGAEDGQDGGHHDPRGARA
jgi:hypothetical protein